MRRTSRSNGRRDVVIDLSGVGFAGSAALGNFVALQRLVKSGGGRIVFCNVDPTVAEVFRASKLDSLFEFVADRPAALRAISERLPAGPGRAKNGRQRSRRQAKPPDSGTRRRPGAPQKSRSRLDVKFRAP